MATVAKVACVYDILATMQNVWTFHVMKTGLPAEWSQGDLLLLTDAVYRYWAGPAPEDWAPLKQRYESTLALNRIEAVAVSPPDPTVFTRNVQELGEGQEVGDRPAKLINPQLAEIIGLRTELDTRRGRGRMFMPARKPFTVVQGSHDEEEGRLTSGRQDELAEQGAMLFRCIDEAALAGQVWRLCVYSRVDDDAHPVTRFSIPDRYHIQRRRRHANVLRRRFTVNGDEVFGE